MSEGFTYETGKTIKRETYEWDNLWWEHSNDTEGKERILIIGDSISCGYRSIINQELQGKIYADGLGTSKSIDNENLLKVIEYFMMQQENYKLILFNSGLHGWHLSAEEYKENYLTYVKYFKEKHADKKLVLVLTTPVRKNTDLSQLEERNAQVILRNQAVLEIAESEAVPVVDLYSLLIDHPEYCSPDGVHQTQEGYKVLAKELVKVIGV